MADAPIVQNHGDKIRLRFRKTGDLRLVSHHDLMRCTERLFRRADLPFRVTQGFHPTPRLVFALSLPLGVVGLHEVLEVELLQPHDPADVLDRLTRASPAGLEFLSAKAIPLKASAVPRRVVYRLPIPENRVDAATLAAERFLAEEKVWVDKHHPRPRQVNVRPYVRGITVDISTVPAALRLDLWVTGQGTARAEDLVRLLGLADVLADGAVLEREELELHDETPAGQPDDPPAGPPETAPLQLPEGGQGSPPRMNHAVATVAASGEDDPSGSGPWEMPATGPVVE